MPLSRSKMIEPTRNICSTLEGSLGIKCTAEPFKLPAAKDNNRQYPAVDVLYNYFHKKKN